jgi:hypothetical protein
MTLDRTDNDMMVYQGASLVRMIAGLTDRAGADVEDGAPGITAWFTVRRARGRGPVAASPAPLHEEAVDLSGYLAAGGIAVELLTPAQSAALPVGDYIYSVRVADLEGSVGDLFVARLAVRFSATALTAAPV